VALKLHRWSPPDAQLPAAAVAAELLAAVVGVVELPVVPAALQCLTYLPLSSVEG
jgi:hypothetical protein